MVGFRSEMRRQNPISKKRARKVSAAIEKVRKIKRLPRRRAPRDVVVACGSAMAMWDLEDTIRDLDLFIPGLPEQRFEVPAGEFGPFEIDAWCEWRGSHHECLTIDRAVCIHGIWVAHPQAIIDFYEALKRPKDAKKLAKLRRLATKVNPWGEDPLDADHPEVQGWVRLKRPWPPRYEDLPDWEIVDGHLWVPYTAIFPIGSTLDKRKGEKSRLNPIKLKVKKRLQWDATQQGDDDVRGVWHRRQGVRRIQAKRQPPSDKAWVWLNEKLPASGYRIPGLKREIDNGILDRVHYTGPRGALLGRGVWGFAYRLETLNGNPSGLMVKITGDPGEVAAAHRLKGATSPVLPEVEGAWGIPEGWWIIIREDVTETCSSSGRGRHLCAALDAIGLELQHRAFDPDHKITFDPEKWKLNHKEKKMIERFRQQLVDVERQTGVVFTDLKSDNIRVRQRGGRKELVVTDFGLSTGPAVSVPMAQNPRVRMRARSNSMSVRKSLKAQYRSEFGSDWWQNPTIKNCLRARLTAKQCAQKLAGPTPILPPVRAKPRPPTPILPPPRRPTPILPPVPAKKRAPVKKTPTTLSVSSGGWSEQGPRDYQEDRWFAQGNLVLVADGMGGHAAGDKAAELAVETVAGNLPRSPDPKLLVQLVDQANTEVYRFGQRHGGKPGCTLTAGLISGGCLYVAHVGDSRCTLVYKGKLTRITRDHSFVQTLVDVGRISEEEARFHPAKNIILRAIGLDPSVEIDTVKVPIKAGQTFVFTSDGVHDFLSNAEFLALVEAGGSAEAVAKRVVKAALANGGNDNTTAVVLKIGGNGAKKNPRRSRRNPTEWIIIDVDKWRLQQAVRNLRQVGLGVRVRDTTEGRKRAIGLKLTLPKGATFTTDEQSKVINWELPWIGTVVGHASQSTLSRPWIDEEIKKRQSQREEWERRAAEPYVSPYRPRGKHSAKPKTKRPWRHRNPR